MMGGLHAVLGLLLVVSQAALSATDPAQGAVWNLKLLFADSAAWEKERTATEASIPGLARLEGTLGNSPASLETALDSISQARQRLLRLKAYAQLRADEDTTNAENQGRLETITNLIARFEENVAFVDPEVLAMGRERVETFERTNPELERHRRPLELILRRASHRLSAETEAAVAATPPCVNNRARFTICSPTPTSPGLP